MSDVMVSVPFGSEMNRLDVSATLVTPGLAVLEVPEFESAGGDDRRLAVLPWRVTHVDSGRLVMAFPSCDLAKRFAESVSDLVDWTLPAEAFPEAAKDAAEGIVTAFCEVLPPPSSLTPCEWARLYR